MGFLWHFAYDWSGGSRVVAAIAPANESVWEHLKLVVIPVIAFALLEMQYGVDRRRLWWAKLVEIAVACGFIVVCFYTYLGALGVDSVTGVDIASYVVAVILGQWISYRLIVSDRTVAPLWLSAVGVTLLIVGFGVLTFTPPHVPLFQETSTGIYGPA
jgi:hypothetical protein